MTPMHISAVMEEWAASQPIKGQMELPLRFCDEVNSEFPSNAKPGADWSTWEEKHA